MNNIGKPKDRTIKESALFHGILQLRWRIQMHNKMYPKKQITFEGVEREFKRQEDLGINNFSFK